MRINYRILWFEDNKSSYNTKKAFVKDIVEDFGFNFIEPRNEIDATNLDEINYQLYDLIIADMNLAGKTTAMHLMDSIRKKSVFTEVLFYSSNGERAVRKELSDYQIDGAYCSGRDNEDFEYKVREVIRTLIKKTQDLTNVRGMVMAEVSELDVFMEKIISEYYSADNESAKASKFHSKITEDIQKSLKKKLIDSTCCDKKCTHIWKDKNVSDIVHSFDFDSSKKAQTVNLIIKEENIKYEATKNNFFEDYKYEVLDVRNNLAHCNSYIINENEVLKIKKEGVEDIIYDENEFKKIRLNLRKYKLLFSKIEQIITQ